VKERVLSLLLWWRGSSRRPFDPIVCCCATSPSAGNPRATLTPSCRCDLKSAGRRSEMLVTPMRCMTSGDQCLFISTDKMPTHASTPSTESAQFKGLGGFLQ
jgi:hypothetical protein